MLSLLPTPHRITNWFFFIFSSRTFLTVKNTLVCLFCEVLTPESFVWISTILCARLFAPWLSWAFKEKSPTNSYWKVVDVCSPLTCPAFEPSELVAHLLHVAPKCSVALPSSPPVMSTLKERKKLENVKLSFVFLRSNVRALKKWFSNYTMESNCFI